MGAASDGNGGLGGKGGNTAGKPGSGGSSATGGSPPTGSAGAGGGIVASSGGASGNGTGSAGMAPGTCFGSEIDVPSVTVSGTIKILDTSPGNLGLVTLVNGVDVVTLGTTATPSFSLRLVPGTYDLVYMGKGNGAHTLRPGVVVAASGDTVLDIAIPNAIIIAPRPEGDPAGPTAQVSVKLSIDGARPSGSLILFATQRGTNNQVRLDGSASSGDVYNGQLAPGTYDFSCISATGEPLVPGWLPTDPNYQPLSAGVVIPNTDPVTLNIDARTAPFSGAITFDGSAVPGCYWLLGRAQVGAPTLALDSTGAFSGRVLPGTFDLVYRGGASGSACPLNTLTTVKRGIVVPPGGTSIGTVDIPSVQVSGKFSLGGAALGTPADDGTLSLRSTDADFISLGKLTAGTYSARIIPGTYDLYFGLSNPLFPVLAPLNTNGKIKSVVLAPGAPITLDIDVPSTLISGTVKIAGSFIDKEYDGGRLWLGDPKTKEGIPLTWTSTGKYSARVMPGTYDVYYEGTSPSAVAPINLRAKLGCLVVP